MSKSSYKPVQAHMKKLADDINELRSVLSACGGDIAVDCPAQLRDRLLTEARWCMDSLRAFQAQLEAAAPPEHLERSSFL
jgi:hypothetical protein